MAGTAKATTPTPSFKVTPFFDAEYLRNGTTYRHNVIEINDTIVARFRKCRDLFSEGNSVNQK